MWDKLKRTVGINGNYAHRMSAAPKDRNPSQIRAVATADRNDVMAKPQTVQHHNAETTHRRSERGKRERNHRKVAKVSECTKVKKRTAIQELEK